MTNTLGLSFSTEHKLSAFIAQIDSLLLSDFPHSSGSDALQLIRQHFEEQKKRLRSAENSKNVQLLERTCATINGRIAQVLPILGFILRSTNIRNSFECYYSLRQLAKELIGENAHVILSSEWELSPLTYPMNVGLLPNFVLLGMPASESSNALLIPLAGHELGHSIWLNQNFEDKYAPLISNSSVRLLKENWNAYLEAFPEQRGLNPSETIFTENMFVAGHLATISDLALRQIEEIFCDAIGVFTFGPAFACAFHYLIAPSLGGERIALEYPPIQDRARYIEELGNLDLKIMGFDNFASEFEEALPEMDKQTRFLSNMADLAAVELATTMYAEAKTIVTTKVTVESLHMDHVESIFSLFTNDVPSDGNCSLADILNAAWLFVFRNRNSHKHELRPLVEWVSELAFKSMEVLEFRSRTNA